MTKRPSLYLRMLVTLTLVLSFSSKVSATVIAEASLSWEFNVPVSFEYASGPSEIGAIYDLTDDGLEVTRATLDALGFARVDVGESFVDARFDASDGTASARVQSVDPAPGSFSRTSSADAVYRIFAFTDVLTFSYSYDFQGTKDNADDWMNFFVQTAVYDLANNGRELLYTDYDPSHPSYQTNWPGDNRSLDLSQDISGTIEFSFGEAGVFRNWVIDTDLLLSARDSAGASVAVAEPSTLSLALFGVLVFLRRSLRQFGRPSAERSLAMTSR